MRRVIRTKNRSQVVHEQRLVKQRCKVTLKENLGGDPVIGKVLHVNGGDGVMNVLKHMTRDFYADKMPESRKVQKVIEFVRVQRKAPLWDVVTASY